MTIDQKFVLMNLAIQLRSATPIGVLGLLEIRNLFANLFEEFAEVRDSELDELIEAYARSMSEFPIESTISEESEDLS
jgi:hypothetical protein